MKLTERVRERDRVLDMICMALVPIRESLRWFGGTFGDEAPAREDCCARRSVGSTPSFSSAVGAASYDTRGNQVSWFKFYGEEKEM